MKITNTIIALPLALAAKVGARQNTNLEYRVSNFSAACEDNSDYCVYTIDVVTSNNPEFRQGCDLLGTSNDGKLPAISETQCGTNTISVAKLDDGGLELTIQTKMQGLKGTYIISSDDLTSEEETVQSYTGDSSFSVDIENGSSASSSVSDSTTSTSAVSLTSAASSSVASESVTTASESSAAEATTSSSASPEETNGASRGSASIGALFAIGLMAFL